MIYTVHNVRQLPEDADPWSSAIWQPAQTILLNHFHARSSSHRPITRAKIVHDNQNIHVAFQVEDQFVRCVNDRYQSNVWEDSCVELFVAPRPGAGYFNFEINCGGAMLLFFIEDPTPAPDALFRKFCEVPIELGNCGAISTSLPGRVEPEIPHPITWALELAAPRLLFEAFLGELGNWTGQQWWCNLFKCADHSSHPHWASWSPIGTELRFHDPRHFASINLS